MKANVLLQGEIGTGKTYALRTLLRCELDPFIISMEPGIETTLGDVICPHGAIHYHYIPPGEVTWKQARDYVTLASSVSLKTLMTTQDPNKDKYTQLRQLFKTCEEFVCDGCKQSFGDVEQWGEDRAIALDGLSGLTKAARQFHIGARPIIGRDDYQPIQGWIELFLERMWSSTKCTAVLLAHVDRRENDINSINQVTIDTAGPALVRKLVRKPDEIITTERDERGNFVWNTAYNVGTVMKHRILPERPDLAPDFSQLFRSTQQR